MQKKKKIIIVIAIFSRAIRVVVFILKNTLLLKHFLDCVFFDFIAWLLKFVFFFFWRSSSRPVNFYSERRTPVCGRYHLYRKCKILIMNLAVTLISLLRTVNILVCTSAFVFCTKSIFRFWTQRGTYWFYNDVWLFVFFSPKTLFKLVKMLRSSRVWHVKTIGLWL